MTDTPMNDFLHESMKLEAEKKKKEESDKKLNHHIINYDINQNLKARVDIEDFINKNDGVELSESCYLVRSNFDHHQVFAKCTKHVYKTLNRFSVTPLDVYEHDGATLAYNLAFFGDKVLTVLRSKGYLYLVDPKYWLV